MYTSVVHDPFPTPRCTALERCCTGVSSLEKQISCTLQCCLELLLIEVATAICVELAKDSGQIVLVRPRVLDGRGLLAGLPTHGPHSSRKFFTQCMKFDSRRFFRKDSQIRVEKIKKTEKRIGDTADEVGGETISSSIYVDDHVRYVSHPELAKRTRTSYAPSFKRPAP